MATMQRGGRGRCGWGVLLTGLIACAEPEPVGLYRLPMAEGPQEVRLRTVLARLEQAQLVLHEVAADRELGRAPIRYGWDGLPQPFAFLDAPEVLHLHLRDGVMEDADERPWATGPVAPTARVGEASRWWLEAGGVGWSVVTAAGALFAEVADDDVTAGRPPSLATLLRGTAGAGLTLPRQPASAGRWRDALSAVVPPREGKAVACGHPRVSLWRAVTDRVALAGGTVSALRVTETIEPCTAGSVVSEPRLVEVERWLAPGRGPVRLRYLLSDGDTGELLLVDARLRPGVGGLWPLALGNRWRFERRDAAGALVPGTEEVEVRGGVLVSP